MAKCLCVLAMEKLYVSAYSGQLQVLTAILLKKKARKLKKPEDGRYRPKHVVFFSIANKHHHLAIYL